MNRAAKQIGRVGFTLIELLVVVAIIALLISILLPSLAAAREQAKRSACAANLKGIAFACLTYAEDSKQGVLPSYTQTGGTKQVARVGKNRTLPTKTAGECESNSRCYFALVLNKSTQPKIYLCPSAMGIVDHKYDKADALRVGTDNPVFDFSGHVGDRPTEMDRFSYSFSNNVVEVTSGGSVMGIATKNTNDPRKAILADRNPYCNKVTPGAVDEGLYEYQTGGVDDPGDAPLQPPLLNGVPNPNYNAALVLKGNSRNHRQQGQNVAYLDGHAKWSRTPRAGADDDFIWTPSKQVTNNNIVGYIDVKPSEMTASQFGQQKSPPGAQTDSFLVP